MAKVAVLGHGVVGSGIVEVLSFNADSIEKRAGEKIEVKYVVDVREFPALPYADKFVKDFTIVENDPEVTVVAESIGGIGVAYDFVKRCLLKGKSVVTSNKELVAKKGAELLKIAKEKNVNFFFEASVGGGIPIIRPLHKCLAGNKIDLIAGILNGTTNYILTKMITENQSFDTALKKAQQLGYAEQNPSADVDGFDTCRKICILSSLAYGKHVYPDYVKTTGITNVSLSDVAFAEDYNSVIKLIGYSSQDENGKINIEVIPALINKECQLSHVDDVYNGILVRGNAIGDAVFYGKGAGKLPTASAVVGDIIEAVKADEMEKSLWWDDSSEEESKNMFSNINNFLCDYYISFKGEFTNEKIKEIVCGKELVVLKSKDKNPCENGIIIKNTT
ncbi:MAG: homoserine dehydrogenase, partial [Oscillospiraceae bacterium]